ncbi:MAG TPA: DUF423 domain-containing protein [Rhodoblastus sp.]|nr:DUF423 domain-containing protein [Rhodoblastus sp.]
MAKWLDALNVCAGLFGACGVAAAAAAAHLPGADHLNAVALILLAHAAALLGLTARARESSPAVKLWLVAALALALGAALFSADVALLTLRGARLFPMAAPTGGTTMILGWLLAGAAGLFDLVRRYR